MKELKDALSLKGLTWKQKAVVWWFCVALCLLFSTADAPLWVYLVEVINVAIPGWKMKGIPVPDYLEECGEEEDLFDD